MTTYQQVFGGATIPPSAYAYRAVSLTADTDLYWPDNSTGSDLVASIMEVTATGAGWKLVLPPADEVSTGRDILFRNVGADSFDVVDNASGAIATVAAGEAKYIYLTSNSTAAGSWSVFTYGTGTSSADASALAGAGLEVDSNQLVLDFPVTEVAGTRAITSADRAQFLVFQGGSLSWTVPDGATVGNGFWCVINNSGTGTLTLDASAAINYIDEVSTKQIQPGESLILCSGGSSNWFTVGYGRSNIFEFTQLAVDVTAGGPITITSAQAANKLWYFYNTAASNVTATIPAVASVYFIRVDSIGAARTVTFTTGSGATVAVGTSSSQVIYCDGTNVTAAQTATVSGTIELEDGTAANPSLFFNLDQDTGIYREGNDQLGIAVGGSSAGYFYLGGWNGKIKKVAITEPATGATITVADGKTFTSSNTITLSGTDGASLNISDAVTGAASSVDNEIALFSGTGGKTIKRATTTGLLKATSGVISAAVSGTDIKTVGGTSLLGSGDISAFSFRNKIIGGDFTTNPWQRGTSFTALAHQSYCADRWGIAYVMDGVVDVLKTADAPTVAESGVYATHCLHADVTTADASIGATQFCLFTHKIEGFNAASFGFGQSGTRYVTLSFWHKHTKTGIYCVSVHNSALSRSHISEYTQDVTDTWEKATITIPVDTSGTWLYDSGIGMRVHFSLAGGSDFHGSANTWLSTADYCTANQVNALDSTSNNFKIALVQLEAGQTATPFETRPYGVELALCQRYYYRLTADSPDYFGFGYCYSTTQLVCYTPFPTTMRTTPTALETNGTANNYGIQWAGANNACNAVPTFSTTTSPYSAVSNFTLTSGLTAGQGGGAYCVVSGAYLGWSAEL